MNDIENWDEEFSYEKTNDFVSEVNAIKRRILKDFPDCRVELESDSHALNVSFNDIKFFVYIAYELNNVPGCFFVEAINYPRFFYKNIDKFKQSSWWFDNGHVISYKELRNILRKASFGKIL